MRNIKCSDCAEYRNEWCEKVIDSPHPDILRDCQYFHYKDSDVIKVIRCKDCKHYNPDVEISDDVLTVMACAMLGEKWYPLSDDYCSYAERRQNGSNKD